MNNENCEMNETSETDEYQNNGMNDSVNYVSSVFQNNEKNGSLSL